MNKLLLLVGITLNILKCNAITYYKNQLLKDTPKDFKSIYERKFAWNYGRESDGFGRAVDIYEDRMLIGACFSEESPEYEPQRKQAGSAHIYAIQNSERGWSYESQLWTNHTKAYDFFGWDLALDNDIAIVGAWQHDDGFEDNGAVYIFEYVTESHKQFWNMTSKVVGLGDREFFGISVAFPPGASYALVGAAGGMDENQQSVGKAYVLGKEQESWGTKWVIMTDLFPASGAAYDYYGISVSAYDLVATVGAYGQDAGNGAVSGAVYVYSAEGDADITNWELQGILTASDGQADDYFGRSVCVYDSTIAVGADGADDSGEKSGAVYVFIRSNDNQWSQTQKLIPAADNENEFFGGSVDIYNDLMIVGADGDNHNDVRTGTAYVYKLSNTYDNVGTYSGVAWEMLYQLYATDRSGRDLYGSDVAIYGSSILIGAEVGDGYDYNSGTAYVYTTPPDFHWLENNAISSGGYAGIVLGALSVLTGALFLAYRYGKLDPLLIAAGIAPQTEKMYRADFDDSRRGHTTAMDISTSSNAPLALHTRDRSYSSQDNDVEMPPTLNPIRIQQQQSAQPPPQEIQQVHTQTPVASAALQLSEFTGDEDSDGDDPNKLRL